MTTTLTYVRKNPSCKTCGVSLYGTKRISYCDAHTPVVGRRKELLDAFNLRAKIHRDWLKQSPTALEELRRTIMEDL